MYIIPVGQNPTGAVNMPFLEILTGLELTRSKRLCLLKGRWRYMIFASNLVNAPQLTEGSEILFNRCIDIIIVEDDPYYFLQEGPYKLPSERSGTFGDLAFNGSDEEYIASLAPSFLSYVYFELPFLYLICYQDLTTKDG